jgi:HD superfamily phosphohydrolase
MSFLIMPRSKIEITPKAFTKTPELKNQNKHFPSMTNNFFQLHSNKIFSSSKLENGEAFKITLAALTHDLGHGAFSHTLEHILHSLGMHSFSHEEMSLKLIERIFSNVPDTLDFTFCRKEFEFLFEGKTGNSSFDALMDRNGLYSIVSDHYNGADCDRMDYLRRDTLNSDLGITFNSFELISKFQFLGEFNGRGNHIAFAKDDVQIFNNFIGLRHQMFRDLYLHEKSTEYELFLSDIVNLFQKELKIKAKTKTLDEFIQLTDK